MPIESDQDWFDATLESHPEFLRRVRGGRADFTAGHCTRLEDIFDDSRDGFPAPKASEPSIHEEHRKHEQR